MTGPQSTGDGRRVLGPKHPRIAELRRLFRRRNSRSPEILLEGPRLVADALDAGVEPVTVLVPESSADAAEVRPVLDRLGAQVEVLVVRDKVFADLAPSVTPQPVLAVAARPGARLPEPASEADVVLVLVEIGDPGNVGTLVRVADAIAAAVVVVGGADPWGPKAVRSSAGSVLRVPPVVADDVDTALGALRRRGTRIVATDVRDGRPHDGGVLAGGPGGVAIVLGSEPRGLDPAIGRLVDDWARIEMPGPAESLNVAMAGTLLAYEARRSASSGWNRT